MMANPTPTRDPLRILCFGDSLTEGYCMFGGHYAPYSTTMEELLNEKLGKKWIIDVDVEGESGDLVLGRFRKRMGTVYSSAETDESLYDWVVFLGGTNDLGSGKAAVKIWDEIKAVTDLPLSTGAQVLLLTVPECGVKVEKLDKKRGALNALILEDGREGVHTLDLHAQIPYWSMPEVERDDVWDDGLHFSPTGYARLGKLVAERLLELLGAKDGVEDDGKGKTKGKK